MFNLAPYLDDEAIWEEEPDALHDPLTSNYPGPHYEGKGDNILYSEGHAARASYPSPPETWHFDGQ